MTQAAGSAGQPQLVTKAVLFAIVKDPNSLDTRIESRNIFCEKRLPFRSPQLHLSKPCATTGANQGRCEDKLTASHCECGL
jgi:hypothetical protein